jgi:transcriptional regulator with XRE-family HTH domain
MPGKRGQSLEERAEARFRDAAGAVFRRLRNERGWSLREFGERVGVAHTSLYAVERCETIPGIHTLAAVAHACDLTLPAMLALINDELIHDYPASTRDHSLAAVVEAAATLTDAQRRDLLGFIGYLRFRDGTDSSRE